MKPKINGIIVVEGTNDAAVISSLCECEIVVLNGCEIKNKNYLKTASKNNDIILLTDPDNEGENIRKKVKEFIPSAIDVRIDLSDCTKGTKKGIAECDVKKLKEVLRSFFENNSENEPYEKFNYLTKKQRNYICEKLGIEECNSKTFSRRMNRLKIDKNKVEELLKN